MNAMPPLAIGAGKIHRTRDGRPVWNVRLLEPSKLWRGTVDGNDFCWLNDGRIVRGVDDPGDLMIDNEPAPVFETGKTYRARGGHTMKITLIGLNSMIGMQTDGDPALRHRMEYDLNGLAKGAGWASFDLVIPGAIEDEPVADEEPKATDNEPNDVWRQRLIDSLRKQLAAQTSTIAGMAAKIESITQDQAIFLRTQMSHDDRISGLYSDMASKFERSDAVITNLNNKVDALYGTLARHIEDLAKKIGKLEVAAVCDPIIASAKSTIKGGWANVYREADSSLSMGKIFSTDAEAARGASNGLIARIQIADITEGEGL